jgi:maltooligosyltrehalose trehalohydrolase
VLGEEAFVLRFFADDAADDRLLVVNLGRDLPLATVAEPLLAPPEAHRWEIRWASEHPRYGGCGMPALAGDESWRLAGHTAVVLRPTQRTSG